jgi:serine/threonine protein kinase
VGISLRQSRYTIKRVLSQSEEKRIMVAVASDAQCNEQPVIVKRWECGDGPLAQRAKQVAHYERATEWLAQLRHPLVPAVLDRFAEGKHYYMVETYIDGESLEERLRKLLRPLTEREVLGYINNLLNVLIALEMQVPPLRHYDISPFNILIEKQRGRAILTGFQIPPAPRPQVGPPDRGPRNRTTRKLVISPYLPITDKPYDQRTCIYALAACMHRALTNVAPPHYPTYPPIRMLNPAISRGLEGILSRALIEDASARYQTYELLKRDILRLL